MQICGVGKSFRSSMVTVSIILYGYGDSLCRDLQSNRTHQQNLGFFYSLMRFDELSTKRVHNFFSRLKCMKSQAKDGERSEMRSSRGLYINIL